MPAKFDVHDAMHYESRAIRAAMRDSEARLRAGKHSVGADLLPQQGAKLQKAWRFDMAQSLREFRPPSEDAGQGDASKSTNEYDVTEEPRFVEMCEALDGFDALGGSAPARERAFYSALRTLLAEIAAEAGGTGTIADRGVGKDGVQAKLNAAYKWYFRSKPQGPAADPVAAAVLATSLSLDTVSLGAGAGAGPRPGSAGTPVRSNSPTTPGQRNHSTVARSARSNVAAGTPSSTNLTNASEHYPSRSVRQEFHGAFSRAKPLAPSHTVSSSGVPGAAAAGARQATGPFVSKTKDMPVVMHPTVASSSPARGAALAAAAAAAHTQRGHHTAAQYRASSIPVYAPGKLVRPAELDEIDYRASLAADAAAAAAASGGASTSGRGGGGLSTYPGSLMALQGAGGGGGAGGAGGGSTKPWLSSLPGYKVGGGGGPEAGQTPGRPNPRQLEEEEREVRALRAKWASMTADAARSDADVERRMAQWTLQRARLEEEMMRRLEATRYAAPTGPAASRSRGGGAGGEEEEDDFFTGSYLSPYAKANAEFAEAAAAEAMGGGDGGAGGIVAASGSRPGTAGSAGVSMPGAGAAAGDTAAQQARHLAAGALLRQRHAGVAQYQRLERRVLMETLLGSGAVASEEEVDRALAPLPDRPFLDCIGRLPRPGAGLESRPGSVRVYGAKKGKKGRSSSGRK